MRQKMLWHLGNCFLTRQGILLSLLAIGRIMIDILISSYTPMTPKNIWTKYSYLWITLILFIGSLVGHWIFAWFSFVNEQVAHNQPIEVSEYLIQTLRDTMENWQSEFLQLIWQVAGLAYLFYIGSPQSKEGDERMEEKLDMILKAVDEKNAADIIKKLEKKYPKK